MKSVKKLAAQIIADVDGVSVLPLHLKDMEDDGNNEEMLRIEKAVQRMVNDADIKYFDKEYDIIISREVKVEVFLENGNIEDFVRNDINRLFENINRKKIIGKYDDIEVYVKLEFYIRKKISDKQAIIDITVEELEH